MALAELLAHIEERARSEIEGIIEKGRTEASRLLSETEERGARAREEHLAREETRLRRELEPLLSKTRLEARRLVSEARRRFASRVFAEIERRLPEIVVTPGCGEILRNELEACLAYTASEPVSVRAAPELVPRLEELIGGRSGVRIEEDPSVATGFLLETGDGALVVDGTLQSRLERMAPELEIELFRRWEAERETDVG